MLRKQRRPDTGPNIQPHVRNRERLLQRIHDLGRHTLHLGPLQHIAQHHTKLVPTKPSHRRLRPHHRLQPLPDLPQQHIPHMVTQRVVTCF
jgi:hypothetical protein